MKTYPIKADLDMYIDPYAAVPQEIIKQNPWHWNPQETNHKDGDSFIYTDASINWFELAEWAVAEANEIRVPQKYWWWDEENEKQCTLMNLLIIVLFLKLVLSGWFKMIIMSTILVTLSLQTMN